MHVVVLTPPNDVSRESALVQALFRNGLKTLHLRKPGGSRAEYRRYLAALPLDVRRGVVMHDHHDLVAEFGLKGVHYTEKTRPATLQRRQGCVQSTAFHALEQLREASDIYGAALDYAFLSPVFDSISKQGYSSAGFDPAETRRVLSTLPFPVYALGGVDVENVQRLEPFGFKGVALLGAVWNASEPVQAFSQINTACRQIQRR